MIPWGLYVFGSTTYYFWPGEEGWRDMAAMCLVSESVSQEAGPQLGYG